MDDALAAQLITVGATLGGVVLTLVGSALVERRRAQEARRLETVRLAAEHTKWLRDERMKAYAGFSLAGEDVLQFLRAELPPLLEPDGPARHAVVAEQWRELRTAMRKAYNQVLLLGGEEPRTIALRNWRLARNGGNDLLEDIAGNNIASDELAGRVKEIGARLGTETNNFLQACRDDLQGG